MENAINWWDVPISRRIDGSPWPLRLFEVSGSKPGSTIAFIGGMLGDKPLAVLSMHRLIDRLRHLELKGSVIVVPAFNLPGLDIGKRFNADHKMINRIFPGSEGGSLADQFAHRLLIELCGRCDAIVDVHSGTSEMALNYVYDHGDSEFSGSWGNDIPVLLDRAIPGQLCTEVAKRGITTCLVEFGGGPFDDSEEGVRGCLNMLRHRGQLTDCPPSPRSTQLFRDVEIFFPSTHGILHGRYSAKHVGQVLEAGVACEVVNALTGEINERFKLKRKAVLLLGVVTPTMVAPGGFAQMVAYLDQEAA